MNKIKKLMICAFFAINCMLQGMKSPCNVTFSDSDQALYKDVKKLVAHKIALFDVLGEGTIVKECRDYCVQKNLPMNRRRLIKHINYTLEFNEDVDKCHEMIANIVMKSDDERTRFVWKETKYLMDRVNQEI